jgi:hypothetical protein
MFAFNLLLFAVEPPMHTKPNRREFLGKAGSAVLLAGSAPMTLQARLSAAPAETKHNSRQRKPSYNPMRPDQERRRRSKRRNGS